MNVKVRMNDMYVLSRFILNNIRPYTIIVTFKTKKF